MFGIIIPLSLAEEVSFLNLKRQLFILVFVSLGFLLLPGISFACQSKQDIAQTSCSNREKAYDEENMPCCANHLSKNDTKDCDGSCRHGSCHCPRSEEHTSELQSLMRISYAVFCLKKKKNNVTINTISIS